MAVQGDFWLRPKRYGYGAEPANWKGWAATGFFAVLVAAIAWLGMVDPALDADAATLARTALTWAALLVMTGTFAWLARLKTDGQWRWRWGGNT